MPSAKLVPELPVPDHATSREFYARILGFEVRYERPEENFSYLDLGGAELMIAGIGLLDDGKTRASVWPRNQSADRGEEDRSDHRAAQGSRDRVVPAGRGSLVSGSDMHSGNRQFLVQDPDGYLLRFFEDLGRHSLPGAGRIVG